MPPLPSRAYRTATRAAG
ncbi:hypothetical protein E2C01_081811 [Portunus trituberculatus]|uniref:Uncharacterized protein n=1 Tax=Portunus trituberculatus TaxID=210409 RepID=A0A5B7IZ44_PORTR|nr:hypothetical protein [Portunus trituberculatus]